MGVTYPLREGLSTAIAKPRTLWQKTPARGNDLTALVPAPLGSDFVRDDLASAISAARASSKDGAEKAVASAILSLDQPSA